MAISMTKFSQDPVYAPFLGAAIGEDQTGANVSVLSMLARLDIDPWVEATDLAHMQDAAARQRLEALLTRFTDVTILVSEQGRVASALLALLPHRAQRAGLRQNPVADPLTLPPAGAPVYWIVATIFIISWIAALAQGH